MSVPRTQPRFGNCRYGYHRGPWNPRQADVRKFLDVLLLANQTEDRGELPEIGQQRTRALLIQIKPPKEGCINF